MSALVQIPSSIQRDEGLTYYAFIIVESISFCCNLFQFNIFKLILGASMMLAKNSRSVHSVHNTKCS